MNVNSGSRGRIAVVVSLASAVVLGTAGVPGVAGESAAARELEGQMAELSAAPGWVPELSSERTNVYRLEDGSYEAEAFTVPVNFVDVEGELTPIDNDLVAAPGDAYAVRNASNDYTVRLPQDAASDPVRVASEGRWLSFQMNGLEGAPTIDGAEATYADAGSDATDVVYEAQPNGVKESIVLGAAPNAPVDFTFDLEMSAGLTPVLRREFGDIEIVDGAGRPAFTMPAPFMTDDAGAMSTDVSYDLEERDAGDWLLRVQPSLDWLQAPSRAYPVVVDPTATEPNSIYDGWIAEASPTTVNSGGNYLRVGGLPGSRRRALLQFTLNQVPVNASVTAASLQLYLDASQTTGSGSMDLAARMVVGGQPWDRDYLTWNRRLQSAAWSTVGGVWTGNDPALSLGGTSSGYKALDATLAVEHWINDGWTNNGFLVKAIGDVDKSLWFYSNNSTDSSKKPKLVVSFTLPANTPPTKPAVGLAASSCIGSCQPLWSATDVTTPTLTATADDTDSATLSTVFEVRDATTAAVVASSEAISGPEGETATWTVPSGALVDQVSYEVRASVWDGSSTRVSDWQPVIVDLDLTPDASTGLSLSPCAEPCASLVSTSLRPTLTAPVTDGDTDVLSAAIEMRMSGSATILATSPSQDILSGDTVEWAVPPGTLGDGQTYQFRSVVSDGSSTRNSSWISFSTSVPTSGPAEPTGFAVSPCSAPCSFWEPTSVRPTFSASRPSGGPASADVVFEVRSPSDTTAQSVVADVAPNSIATWEVPAGWLGGSNVYFARVGARASGITTWSGWRRFVVATVADAGVAEPSLDAGEGEADDPIDPTEVGITELTEDEQTFPAYTDSDLDALDATADAEYQARVDAGVAEPDAIQSNRIVTVWEKYAPVLFIHPDERYGPLSARTSLKHSNLMWSHDGCRDSDRADHINPDKLGDGGYTHRVMTCIHGIPAGHYGTHWPSDGFVGPKKDGGPSGNEGFYININNDYRTTGTGKEPVYYIFKSGQYIQYFFHYGFSKNRLLDDDLGHEGDWESIAIKLTNGNDPIGVQYFYHHSSCVLYWSDVPKKNRKHPRVAVGKHTHASYPMGGDPPIYEALPTLDNGTKWYANANLDNAETQDWYNYGGIWGENGNYSWTSGVLGPSAARRHQEDEDPPDFTAPYCEF